MDVTNRISNPWKYGITVMFGATFAFFLLLLAMIIYGDVTVSKNIVVFSVEYSALGTFVMIIGFWIWGSFK